MDVGSITGEELTIKLNDETPITYRPYRMSPEERTRVYDIISDLLEADIVRESNSPFASPILLVKKKNGESRLCIDYRKLNRAAIKDRYPLPIIDDQLSGLQGSTYFTTLDMTSGYYQIPVEEKSKEKTAFITPDGQFEFNRMPFGLTNAPSVFQRMVDKILGALKGSKGSPTRDFEGGIRNLRIILNIIPANQQKCAFF